MLKVLESNLQDLKFFTNKGPFELGYLASLVNASVYKDAKKIDVSGLNCNIKVHDIKPLNKATGVDLSFFTNSKYSEHYKNTQALVCITSRKYIESAPKATYLLVTDNSSLAYAKIVGLFYDTTIKTLHSNAQNSFVSKSAQIGKNTKILPGVYIGDNVVIGENCIIRHGVTITDAIIGNNTIIHAGTRIGQDGFGYATENGEHIKIPQIGRVVIGNDVEIGANCTIDRGSIEDTIIGDMCKLDNLIQIGHNVVLGRGCIVVSQTGISGSTTVGKYVTLGGQAGIAGHLEIGDFAQIAAKSGVMKDIKAKEIVCGSPAQPIKEFFRQVAALKKLTGK